ncbi:peptidylprolyl isomerase [Eikenella longinqua]|uniref:Peptidylprolyl isomerase n=2 Tax=Eikenella longinqua TaxID=1795827 RepID=A0A1A9RYQ2_9NEIS|nr:peptidylprolyl isomerase [Eikenella longinqua]
MKMKPLLAALGLCLTFQVASADTVKSVDNIVAVVENEVITQRELSQAIAHSRSQLPRGSQVPEQDLQRQTLMQLVNQSLLVQAGKRNNIEVPDGEVEGEIARIAAARRQSVAQFEAAQARLGIDKAGLRRQVRDSLIAQRVQQGQVASAAKVSDEEVSAAINRARAQGMTLPQATPKPRYHAQHILISGQGERAQRLAQRLSQDAKAGADFGQLARQYSQDAGSAGNGGELGWLSVGETVPEFERAMSALKPGEISRPVRSQFGWHVIRLVEVRTPNTPEDRIRAGVHDAIAAQKTQAAMQRLLQQLHEGSFISIRM